MSAETERVIEGLISIPSFTLLETILMMVMITSTTIIGIIIPIIGIITMILLRNSYNKKQGYSWKK